MKTINNFKGKIFFVEGNSNKDNLGEKKLLMSYYSEPNEVGFEETIMSSFDYLNFSSDEKKNLSSKHRKILNKYRHINQFALSADAHKLVTELEKNKSPNIVIEANDYGVYICLAALYSGKLPLNKKIEFHFKSSPLALFPKSLLKRVSKSLPHKIVFHVKENCWLSPFSTLYNHDQIKCFYLKAA